MKLALVRLVADLRGGSGRRFVELLAGQIDAALEGARLVEGAARGGLSWREARRQMREVEHRGDRCRAALLRELSHSLATPIDREDLGRLSRSIDDVLDNLRDAARLADLLSVDQLPALVAPAEAIVAALDELHQAVAAVADAPDQMAQRAVRAGKASGRVRRAYDYELAELYEGEVDVDLLKQRELLRRLDVVGLRLGEAADALADAAVKRSVN